MLPCPFCFRPRVLRLLLASGLPCVRGDATRLRETDGRLLQRLPTTILLLFFPSHPFLVFPCSWELLKHTRNREGPSARLTVNKHTATSEKLPGLVPFGSSTRLPPPHLRRLLLFRASGCPGTSSSQSRLSRRTRLRWLQTPAAHRLTTLTSSISSSQRRAASRPSLPTEAAMPAWPSSSSSVRPFLALLAQGEAYEAVLSVTDKELAALCLQPSLAPCVSCVHPRLRKSGRPQRSDSSLPLPPALRLLPDV